MTDRVILPLADGRWLALDPESFQQALLQGNKLMPLEQANRQDDEKPQWLPVREVARLCNISETFLYDEIKLKRIRSRLLGRAVRIHRDFVEHQTGDLMSNDDGGE